MLIRKRWKICAAARKIRFLRRFHRNNAAWFEQSVAKARRKTELHCDQKTCTGENVQQDHWKFLIEQSVRLFKILSRLSHTTTLLLSRDIVAIAFTKRHSYSSPTRSVIALVPYAFFPRSSLVTATLRMSAPCATCTKHGALSSDKDFSLNQCSKFFV